MALKMTVIFHFLDESIEKFMDYSSKFFGGHKSLVEFQMIFFIHGRCYGPWSKLP
jgi:hypothetical protein